MKAKAKTAIIQKFASFFGSLGYLSFTVQWFWAIIMYSSLLSFFEIPIDIIKNPVRPPVVAPQGTSIEPLAIFFAIAITVLMVAIMLYVVIKLPSNVAKASEKIVISTAEKAVPLVIKLQGKKNTKKMRLKLTEKTILVLKLILIITPIILVFVSQFTTRPEIETKVAMIVAVGLAGFSFLYFTIQYILVKAYKIKLIK